ncbi:unnamed protein product [Orchesella dallaii]|uniref:Uncharacterized protein n=1 Tax=Orchesella dallaii TaxID=48710 RepID=A0ABP1R3B5_9HEXA
MMRLSSRSLQSSESNGNAYQTKPKWCSMKEMGDGDGLKLLVAIIMYFLTEWFASYLESMYLPPGVVPSSTLSSFQPQPEQPAKKTVRIRVSKSRAKYLTANSEADLTNLETVKVTLMRVFVEYMYFSSVIANYRWCFLGIIFIVYGILHAILLFCFSPTSKSGDDDDDDEDDEENLNDEDEIIDENIPDFRF